MTFHPLAQSRDIYGFNGTKFKIQPEPDWTYQYQDLEETCQCDNYREKFIRLLDFTDHLKRLHGAVRRTWIWRLVDAIKNTITSYYTLHSADMQQVHGNRYDQGLSDPLQGSRLRSISRQAIESGEQPEQPSAITLSAGASIGERTSKFHIQCITTEALGGDSHPVLSVGGLLTHNNIAPKEQDAAVVDAVLGFPAFEKDCPCDTFQLERQSKATIAVEQCQPVAPEHISVSPASPLLADEERKECRFVGGIGPCESQGSGANVLPMSLSLPMETDDYLVGLLEFTYKRADGTIHRKPVDEMMKRYGTRRVFGL